MIEQTSAAIRPYFEQRSSPACLAPYFLFEVFAAEAHKVASMLELQLPIFLINVDRHRQRLEQSEKEFAAHGIAFTRVSAVDHLDLTSDEIERVASKASSPDIKYNINSGEIACYLSHINVWRKIAEGDSPMAFVFEDDVQFAPGIADILLKIETGPLDWDVLRLYSNKPKPIMHPRTLGAKHAIGSVEKIPMSTIAYAITRSAARHLAENSIPFYLPVDADLKRWWANRLCTKIIDPPVAWPRNADPASSTLHQGRNAQRGNDLMTRMINNLRYHRNIARKIQENRINFPTTRQFFD